MKKQEMEEAHGRYHDLMGEARKLERQGLIHKAVETALAAWDDVDGMMQYSRKYEEKEFTSIAAIEFVLKYTPMLLETTVLERLEALLKEKRAVERNTSVSLKDRLAEVTEQVHDNHRLWNLLESQSDVMQSDLTKILGGDQDYWRSTCETWERMGLVRRTPKSGSYQLNFTTRMGQVISGKCPSCGGTIEAPKSMLLEQLKCPECGGKSLFVLIPHGVASK